MSIVENLSIFNARFVKVNDKSDDSEAYFESDSTFAYTYFLERGENVNGKEQDTSG